MRSNPVDVRRWIRTPFCRGAFQHRPIAGRTLRRARKNTTPVATGSHFPAHDTDLPARFRACCPSADASLWFDRGFDREIEPSAARFRRIETSIRTNPDSISQQAGETGHLHSQQRPNVRTTHRNHASASGNPGLRESGLCRSHALRPIRKTASQRIRPGLFYEQRSQKNVVVRTSIRQRMFA